MQHKFIFGLVILLILCLAYFYMDFQEGFVEEDIDLTATYTIAGYPYDDGRIPDVSDGYMIVDMSSNITVGVSGEGYNIANKRWYPGQFTNVVSGTTFTIKYKNDIPVTTEDLSGNRVRMLKKKVRIPTGYLVDPNNSKKLIADPKYDVQYYSATLYQQTNDATLNAPPYTDIPAGGLPDDQYKVKKTEYKTDSAGKLVLNQDPAPTNKMKKLPDPLPTGYKKSTTGTLEFDLTRYALAKYSSTYSTDTTIQYHPEDVSGASDNTGSFYNFNSLGQLIENKMTDMSFAPIVYYVPGAYKFGASNYVPNYEDSVYLSRTTQHPQMAPVYETAGYPGGFCNQYKGNVGALEEKCASLDTNTCASTRCCVLIGGQKCVAGNENGPSRVANYSDYNLQNRDFYYYNGKCYGNCT